MPDTMTAPAAAAAPATTSAPTTSAPASSSSSSATPTTSAPAVGAETTAATITDTGAQPSPFEGKSIEDTIFKTLEEKRLAREKAASGETTVAQTEDDKLAAELKAGETTEDKTGDELKTETDPASEFDLDEPDFSTKWLDDLAKENKITFADDRAKGQLFKVVREHNEFKPIAEIFGGDVEEAKAAQTGSLSFNHFDGLYENAHTPQGTKSFLEALAAKQQQEPIIGQDGQPVDVVSALFTNMRDMELQFLESKFTEKGDDEALAALDILRERISPNRAPASEETNPEMAKREAAVQAREEKLNRDQQQQSESARTQYEQSVATDLDKEVGKVIDPVLGKTAFSDVIKGDVKEKIFDRVEAKLNASQLYKSRLQTLLNKPPTAENKAAVLAFSMKWFNQVAGDVMRSTINEYRNPVVQAQADRDTRQRQQEDRSRVNPKGPSVSTAPAAQLSKEQQISKTIDDLKTKLGRQPNQEEILGAWMNAKHQARAAHGS